MAEEWWASRDIETLRLLRDELQRSHTEALQTFTDLSNTAGQLLAVIGTTLTIIVAAAALVSDIPSYIHPLTEIGVGLIILSGVATILSQQSRNVPVGAGKQEFQQALGVQPKNENASDYEYAPTDGTPFDEYQYLAWIVRNYIRWIDDILEENSKKAKRIRAGEYLYITGLAGVLVGTFLTL